MRLNLLERDMDASYRHTRELGLAVETLRAQTIEGFSKKADYSLLEKVRDTLAKKVDSDSFQQQVARLRGDITLQMDIAIEEKENRTMAFDKDIQQQTQMLQLQSVKAVDEQKWFREQLHRMNQDKKDQIDEIAGMLVSSTKDVNISLVNLKTEMVDRIKLTSDKDSQRTIALLADKIEYQQLSIALKALQSDLQSEIGKRIGGSDIDGKLKEAEKTILAKFGEGMKELGFIITKIDEQMCEKVDLQSKYLLVK